MDADEFEEYLAEAEGTIPQHKVWERFMIEVIRRLERIEDEIERLP